MRRFWSWLPALAAYGALIAAATRMAPEWVTVQDAWIGAALLLLYATAAATFGPWRALGLAVCPALCIANFALFMDAAAYDCHPECGTYERVLGAALPVTAGTCLVVVALALRHVARRPRRRRSRTLYD